MRRDRRTPATTAAVMAALAAGILVGCGGSDDKPASAPLTRMTYVGRLAGSRALVGIVTRGDAVRAYVCDGRRLGSWFNGRLDNGSVSVSAAGGARLTAVVGPQSVTGSVTIRGGRSMRFEAVAAVPEAGLYRGSAKGYVAGWIVLADGTQRGVVTTKTTLFAAPTLSSTAISDGRIAITPIPIPASTTVPIPIRIAPGGGIGV